MAFWNRRKKQAPPPSVPPSFPTVEPVSSPPPPSEPPKRLLSYQVANLQGVGTRPRQEDGFAFVNAMDVAEMKRSGLLAIVADGMGGMRDGRVASQTAISVMKAGFQALDRSGSIPEQLEESVIQAGREVYRTLGGDGGSTAVVCLFYNEQLYFTSVGDSGLYLLREGTLLRLNLEHNVRNERFLETIRQGSMDPEIAREDPEAAALTQFLGMGGAVRADSLRRPMHLHDGDLLLLCSDGVDGTLTEAQMLACLGEASPEAMCQALERAILEENRQYQDNYTALIVRCGY